MTSLFYLLTPFSYFEFSGFRVILLQVFLGLAIALCILFKRPKIFLNSSFLALAFLVFITAFYAFFSGYYESLMAVTVFALLMFFSFYFAGKRLILMQSLKNIYVLTCLFVASGLILQLLVHKFFGVILFRHALFGGSRNAYSFIWRDYSFISLFVVSCLPIVWGYKNRLLALSITFVLLLASIVSSARTGIAAVILFFALLLSWKYLIALIKGRIALKYFLLAAVVIGVPFLLMYTLPLITGRQLTVSSSGRFEGFALGFQFFLEQPFFGALLDKEFYKAAVAYVPHNIFLFPLFMGGVVYFFAFMIFMVLLAETIRNADFDILAAVLICFLGFQFIPSFFSAYFFAILLGIAMASSKLNRKNLTEESNNNA